MIIGITASLPPPPTTTKAMLGPQWRAIDAIGRHADAGKLVFIGERVYDNNRSRTIGVLDKATGIVTYLEFALAATGGTGWTGIDCDRSTGLYVAAATSQGGYFNAYWSTDLINWTQCASPSTQFNGNSFVLYDDTHQVWYWQTGTQLFISSDGKTYANQPVINIGFGTVNTGSTYKNPMRSEVNPLDTNVMLFIANSGRVYRADPDPIPEAPMSTVNFVEAISPGVPVFTHSNDPRFSGGVVAFNGAVYIMNQLGEIVKNDSTMLAGTWTQIAEKGTGNPGNELIDTTFNFVNLTVIDGVFWCQRNATNLWYSYTAGGEPVGYGWAAGIPTWMDAGVDTREGNFMIPTIDDPLVYSGYIIAAGNPYEHYIYYT